jgi:hypothetical protein
MRVKWTREKIQEVANKYTRRRDFELNDTNAYAAASRRGILQEVCQHMPPTKEFDWTEEKLMAIANRYKVLKDFNENEQAAYAYAYKSGLYEKATAHMIKRKPIYTEDYLRQLVSNFKTVNEFREAHLVAYNTLRKKGLTHLLEHLEARNNWDEQSLREVASKYQTVKDFRVNETSAYATASARGVLMDITSHMPRKEVVRWTKKAIHELALKYKNRMAFETQATNAYAAATRRGILDEVCSHMTPRYRYWSYVDVANEALKYQTRNDFKHGTPSAYDAARRVFNCLDEVCAHMGKKVTGTANDAIYVWKADETLGDNVYKIGVTSYRFGDRRMKMVANTWGVAYEVVVFEKVRSAIEVEREVLKLGHKPDLPKLDGYTEFRVLTHDDMMAVSNIIAKHT